MSENHVIGRGNKLPWHLPADLQRFKELTIGHAIIMGRRTFESIGKPLPGRRSIVITRDGNWKTPNGVEVAHGLSTAISMARTSVNEGDEIFVIGGAEVFRQALPLADRIHLTLVRANIEGDMRFPTIEARDWKLVRNEDRPADGQNEHAMSFQILERVR